MKKIFIVALAVMLCAGTAFADVPIDAAHFPDPVFREWVSGYDRIGYDEDGKEKWGAEYADGVLSGREIENITGFYPEYYDENADNRIKSFEGIKYLTSLKTITAKFQDATEFDISGLKKLTRLEFVGSKTLPTSVKAEGCTNLDYVKVSNGGGSVKKLNLSGCSSLRTLYLLTVDEIDLTGCSSLKWFDSTYGVNKVDFSDCVALEFLRIIHSKERTSLDIHGLKNLKSVSVYGCDKLISMDVSGCTALESLICYYTSYRTYYRNELLESINLKGCKNLLRFACPSSNLKSIDLTSCSKLEELDLGWNKLTVLDVSKNKALKKIDVYGNKLTYLDLNNNSALEGGWVSVANQCPEVIKAIPYGKKWKVNLTDYMPKAKVKNIVPSSIETSSSYYYGLGKCSVSFDVKNCALIITTPSSLPPTFLRYYYNTNSSTNATMNVDIKQRETYPKVYRASIEAVDVNKKGYLYAKDKYIAESYNFGYYKSGYSTAETGNGLAADGNSRLFIRVTPPVAGSVTFTIPETIGATLEPLNRSKSSKKSIVIKTTEYSTGKYSATAVLTAPESYPSGKKLPSLSFEMKVKFIDYEGNVTTETRYLQLHVAPVVLVHGLRGKCDSTFNIKGGEGKSGIWYQLKKAGYDPDFNIGLCDYDGTKGPEDLLASNNNCVYYALARSFSPYRSYGIECTRADLVCHSMGGLMARKYLEDCAHSGNDGHNKSIISYSQGMVRRVVTVATPHRGSPFADFFLNRDMLTFQVRHVLNGILNFVAGTHFQTAESAYKSLKMGNKSYGYPSKVPMHSIASDLKSAVDGLKPNALFFPQLAIAASELRAFFALVFAGGGHDLIVPLSSAVGDFNTKYTTVFNKENAAEKIAGYSHIGICERNDVGLKVVELLKGPVSNFQIGSYNLPSVKPAIKGDIISGTKGVAYEKQLTLSKGSEFYTFWTAVSGLPDGLTLSPSGLLSGTPTKAKTYNFRVKATNEAGSSTYTFVATVNQKPSITTKSISTGESDKSYTFTMTATGTKPITWTATGLPSGITMDKTTGVIKGKAVSCVGKFTVKVTAKNMAGTATKSYTFTMKGITPAIASKTLPLGVKGTKYSAQLSLSKGYYNPTKWSASGLPSGLSIANKTGIISGTPKKSGTFTAKITAENAAGKATKSFKITVNEKPSITTSSLAAGTVGKTYKTTLKASGTTPLTWTAAELPSGLSIAKKTGVISGTPKKSGAFTVKITVENAAGKATKSFKITVNEKPSITTSALAAGTVGKTYKTTLKASGTTPLTWTAAGLPSGLSITKGTGVISGTPKKSGAFTVKITAKNAAGSVSKKLTLTIKETKSTATSSAQGSNSPSNETQKIQTDAANVIPQITHNGMTSNVSAKNNPVSIPNSYEIIATLPVISSDEPGLYYFDAELYEFSPEGAELIYIANSSEPSEDDEIVEFYDHEGAEITTVPSNRKITVGIWLRKGIIYSPAVCVKGD